MRTIGITDAMVSFALLGADRSAAEHRLDELVDRWG
jgi:hypothetical protein